MINQFAKRPTSRHRANLRPVTAQASEQNKKQSNECFEIAKKHMIKKQYDQAIKHYTNATIHNPKNYKAFCNMGKIYKEIGKFAQARNCYNKALFANPIDPITLYNLANLQRISGNDDLSIFLYAKVASLKQKQNMDIGQLYYDAIINQGICFKNLQLYDQAIQCNDKAIAISPNDQSAHFNKGMCLLKKIYSLVNKNFVNVKKKLCKDCQIVFKKVLETNPNKFTGKMALIQLIYLDEPSQNSFNQALKQFLQLQKIAPSDQIFQLSLKIKYCQNQLKKIDQAKIILAPQQDIVQRVPTANKYDNQGQNRNKKSSHGKRQIKQVKSSIDIQKQLKSGRSIRSLIDYFVEQKKFDQAFNLVQRLPDGMQKYQCEIIINYSQCVDSQNQAFLSSAIAIYNDFVIKNNPNTPITKDLCTQKGHEIMANMLTVYGNYTQASKHYQVLLQSIQDQKFNKDKKAQQKIKQIHAQLGICYAQRGLLRQAISQYKKSYQMQPDNYFLMTNLCGLLVQDNQHKQARQYYQAYLKKNGGQNIADKVVYIDSLINISVCVRQTPEQEVAIQKVLDSIAKYYPTYQDIKANLYQQAILGVYLRQSQILQQKSEAVMPNSPSKKQLYQKMLDNYLTCLEFENCPDRQAICINTGILFYLGGCYVNALNFYQAVTLNKKVIANNIALTCLHLQEFEIGVSCLQYAVQQYPQNIVYATNFEIAKWMCGLSDKNLISKYNCKCETMYETRVNFGLWMLDQLTTLIDQNQIKIQNNKDSNLTVNSQVQNIINILIQKSQNSQINKERTQTWKSKVKVLTRKLNDHAKQFHSPGQNKPKQLVNNQLLELCLKKCNDSKQFQLQLTKIMDNLNGLTKNSSNFTIVQSLISLAFIVNSHILDSTEIMRTVISKKQIINTTSPIQSFQTKQFKQSKGDYIIKKNVINYPTVQLKFKLIQNMIKQNECMLENMTFYLIQMIQNTYYSQPENILSALNKQYKHPHCQSQSPCLRCLIASTALYSGIFAQRIGGQIKINKDWTVKQEINSLVQAITIFVKQNLEKQTNNVFSKTTNELVVKFQDKQMPILLKTHHKTFANVIDFVKKLDSTFALTAQPSNHNKGVRIIHINKSIVLEMFWGQNVTSLDRYCQWMSRRPTNFNHDAALLLGQQLKDIEQIFEDGPKSIAKINTTLYQK